MIIIGVLLGLFVGGWLCFIGGIIQIIEEIQSSEGIRSLSIAFGVTRMAFAGLTGYLSAMILIIPGYNLTKYS